MRIINILFLLLLPCFSIFARSIDKTEAYSLVKKEFSGQDVSYFLITNCEVGKWMFFVDADPLAGWEHECYILVVPKESSLSTSALKASKTLYSMPPLEYEYEPLDLYSPHGIYENDKPVVEYSDPEINCAAACNTHAIILSGGVSKKMNYQRYWNDCSFIYQVLTRRFWLPKTHIHAMISNGRGTSIDMQTVNGHYVTSSNDLDGDGEDDIDYVAAKSNVEVVFRTFARNLKDGDQVLLYVIDHGGRENGHSYICLWGGERLYDYELANMIRPLCENGVSVNVVLGQCFSGGFLDDLDMEGCVAVAACGPYESSYASKIRPYDEFVYFWTSAVAGYTAYGNETDADYNDDGDITMDEAFLYAKTHDLCEKEHPMFQSNPSNLAENLAFSRITLRSMLPMISDLELYEASSREAFLKDLKVENFEETIVYDLMGRRVRNTIPGHIYIKEGKKHIAR